ncbi:hypothetical protein AXG89_22990 (plasmid) [Burkholderia sp. PAMC 26561]|nr:hypothetical protein AXG89_22990 [Burkholderia sp. PAMC 26561]
MIAVGIGLQGDLLHQYGMVCATSANKCVLHKLFGADLRTHAAPGADIEVHRTITKRSNVFLPDGERSVYYTRLALYTA